jgi:hypothetical protein
MRRAHILATTILAVAVSLPALPADAPPPPKEKVADVKRLLRIALGATFDALVDVYRQGAPHLPESYWTRFREEFTGGELLDGIAVVYARNLADEDVKPLLAFYESDAARRFFAAQPQIMKESLPLITDWAQRTFERLQRECAPPDQTKS